MGKARLEAFSDGVIAIIITIMVLELRPPHDKHLSDLYHLWPALLSYVLSFLYVGIYWNNHHHIFHAAQRVSGMTLWANLHLLFWLSLIPFVTNWMGDTHFSTWPVVAYGFVLLMCATAWEIERRILISHHDDESILVRALRTNVKELASLVIYLIAIALAFVTPWVSCTLYFSVAVMWFVPDRRIERAMKE